MSRCFPLPRSGTEWTETRALFPKNYAKHKKEKKDKHKRGEKETDKGKSNNKHREKKGHKENQVNPEQNHKKKHKKEKKDKQKDKDKSKEKNKEKKNHKENHEDKSHKDGDIDDESRSLEGSSNEEERSDGYSELKHDDCSHGLQIKASKLKVVLDKRIKDEDKCTMNNMAEDSTCSIQGRTNGMGMVAAVKTQNCTGTGMAVNIVRTGKRGTDETSQLEDIFSRSIIKAQKVEPMGSATVMEKANSSRNGKLNGTEKIRSHRVGCIVEVSTGSNKEGANKVSNSIATMISDVIGTEQRKNQGLGTSEYNTIKKGNDISSVADGSIYKRKSNKMSDSLNENGAWPKKIQRTNVSSSLPLQNGRALERHQIARHLISHKFSISSQKINGMEREQIAKHLISHESSISSQKINGIMSKPNAAEPEKIRPTNISSNLHLENGRALEYVLIDRYSISPEANISSQKINDKKSLSSSMSSKSPIAANNRHKRHLKSQEDDAPPNKTRRTSTSPITSEPCQIEKHSVSPPAMKSSHANDAWVIENPSTSDPSNLPLEKGISESCHVAGGTCEDPSNSVHPDSMYLSQLYQIPKMEELSEFPDEEWLFCSNGGRIKPKTKLKDEEGPLVWANAMRIESADIIALPYVMIF